MTRVRPIRATLYGLAAEGAPRGVLDSFLSPPYDVIDSAQRDALVAQNARNSVLLDLPERFHQAALLPVAYTTGLDFKPGPRLPRAEVIHWNGW